MLRRVRDAFPWTPLGVGVGLAAAAGDRFFAGPESDYVLRVVAGGLLLLTVLAALGASVALLALMRAFRRAERPALHGEAGRGTLEASRFPYFGGLLAMRADVEWLAPAGARPALAPGHGAERVETVRFDRRRGDGRVRRRWRVEDPFGLARVQWTRTDSQPLRIAPWRGQLDRCPALVSLARGDAVPHPSGPAEGDPMDLRPYQPGDPLRLVAWKIFARTGELDVRVPERAHSPRTRTAAFLVSGPDDEPAAAAAWVALERGLLGDDWLFGTDGAEPTSDADTARTAILESAALDGGGRDLAAFLDAARRPGPVRVVLFAPGRPGPWLARCLAQAGPELTAVIVVDAVAPKSTRPAWWKQPDPPPAGRVIATSRDVASVASSFERQGSPTLALARTDGRVLGRRGAGRLVA